MPTRKERSIVVTGSAGFVGKELCATLSASRYSFIEIDHAFGQDVKDFKTFEKLTDFSCIVHLAAKSFVPESFENPHSFYDTNVNGMLNVLEAARKNDAKVIFLSSYLYGNPEYLPVDEVHPLTPHNPYAQTKLICEQLCQAYYRDFGVKSIIFRPFNIFGKGQNSNFLIPIIVDQSSAGNVTLMDPRPKRDYVYVSDVVDAIVLAIENKTIDHEVFNLGTGSSYSIATLVDTVVKLTGRDVKVNFRNEFRKNEVLDCIANIQKASKLLGWQPKVSLEDGLRIILK